EFLGDFSFEAETREDESQGGRGRDVRKDDIRAEVVCYRSTRRVSGAMVMKPRILVVDDEPIIAENLRLILEREGYEVETAVSSATAMLRAEEREFSLALVDLVLPDGDGLQLLRMLKSKDSSLEVIIMTGHSSIGKAVEATKQGAFYFVAKPFDAEEM